MRTEHFWQTGVTPPRWWRVLVVVLAVAALGTSWALAESVTRVSRDSAGTQGNSDSHAPALSADGRLVVFYSYASNLVPGDTNGADDVFVHDRQTGTTTRVSRGSAGTQGNNGSRAPTLSADGRLVAFYSDASNLVPEDTNDTGDVFVHNRQTGTTTRVSRDSAGTQGNDSSRVPTLSADGRLVAFYSIASNLVPGDTNDTGDVFVHDRQTGTTTLVSRDSVGIQGNSISFAPTFSADGRLVAFHSYASNLVPGDTNSAADVFVHNRQTGTTTRVSRDSAGTQGNSGSFAPTLSADGRLVAFDSYASNLVPGDNHTGDVFVHDRQTGTTTRVSRNSAGTQGNSDSFAPTLSADGRLVAFDSYASNLVPGDNHTGDVFVHDRQTGTTIRVSRDSAGTQGNSASHGTALSADGRLVAFHSYASNLVPGDTNRAADVFVYDPFVCYGLLVTIMGTPGNDVLVGTAGDDVIDGLDGNDTLSGGGGNDVLCGGAGQDRLRGGVGSDRLLGGAGADVLQGGSGQDRLAGGPGDDTLYGGPGQDRLAGGLGDDILYGEDGRDRLYGRGGDDALDGGADDDYLDGGGDSDVCDGGLQTLADTAAVTCETIVNVP